MDATIVHILIARVHISSTIWHAGKEIFLSKMQQELSVPQFIHSIVICRKFILTTVICTVLILTHSTTEETSSKDLISKRSWIQNTKPVPFLSPHYNLSTICITFWIPFVISHIHPWIRCLPVPDGGGKHAWGPLPGFEISQISGPWKSL